MRARLRWTALATIAVAVAVVACNALTGAHERFLDETDPDDAGRPKKDTGTTVEDKDAKPTGDDDDDDIDAGDAGKQIVTVDVPITAASQWSTPNKATASFDGGTVITNFNSPHDNHPMIVPIPFPSPFPATKYTVKARIKAHTQAEYGIFVRGREITTGFSVFVLSSRYSKGPQPVNEPFLAPLLTARKDQTNDDPPSAGVANGPAYSYEAGHTWIFTLEVDETNLHGTITREDNPAITSDMRLTDPTPAADRGTSFGFYAYQAPAAALLQLQLIY